MKRFLTFLYLVFLHSSVSTAAVVIDMFEKDGGVVAIATGTINLAGLTPTDRGSTVVYEGTFRGGLGFVQPGVIGPLDGVIFVGQGGGSVDEYIIETTHLFSTGVGWSAQSNSGNHVGIISRSDMGDSITVPKNYNSGDFISGTSTWPELQGATLEAMKAIPGTYVFTWGSGPTADSLTLNIGGSAPPPENSFTGTLPSGATGTLSFTSTDTDCAFAGDPQFLSEDSVTPAPQEGVSTIDGVVQFTIDSCAVEATVNISMDYGVALSADATYWKAADPWHEIVGATITGSVVEFSITDGGLGDDDGLANGQIVDTSGAVLASGSATDVFTDGFED